MPPLASIMPPDVKPDSALESLTATSELVMGINALTVQWLARLARAGVLPKGGSWVELGPQDFVEDQVTLDVLHHALDPIVGSANPEASKIFPVPSEPPAPQPAFLYHSFAPAPF